MTTDIEQRLIDISEYSDSGKMLRAQWEHDKRLLHRALSTIITNFPHYSQHDSSHSDTILHRIASILGPERIKVLSATDLWLILEAAYNHDVGMVTLAVQKENDLESPEFKKFLDELAVGDDKKLAACAASVNSPVMLESSILLYRLHLNQLFLYAEFNRRRHPARSREAVLEPLSSLALDLPRSGLIPKRLWRVLGDICLAHGKPFEFTMELPYRELGLTTDYCHPRFVSCLLRLGDLLDLDSGRFCPCVNAQVPRLPDVSEVHREKHEGVTHFLVSEDLVEVDAEYKNVDAYFEAERWFSWLKQELIDQTLSWKMIQPNESFGQPPAIGKIQARLTGQILLGNNARPRLEVDREKLLNIVRGGNIYEGPWDALREIIQNAIDATILRYSLDAQSMSLQKPKDPSDLRNKLKQYPIEVNFEKVGDKLASGVWVWVLTVKDLGIGITRGDAARLLSVGSAKRSEDRRNLTNWLPEWARPSGEFGIGFNSLFEYCKHVVVHSRHPNHRESLTIDFDRQSISDDPRVVITGADPVSESELTRPGTCVTAYFELAPMPQTISSSFALIHSAIRNFDAIVDDSLDYVPLRIKEAAEGMASDSLCSFKLFGSKQSFDAEHKFIGSFFCEKSGVDLSLHRVDFGSHPIATSFRSMAVANKLSSPFVSLRANIHAGNAADLLRLSRNEWTRDGQSFVRKRIEDALDDALEYWTDEKSDLPEEAVNKIVLFKAARNGSFELDGRWKKVQIDGVCIGNISESKLMKIDFMRGDAGRREFKVSCKDGESCLTNPSQIGSGWLAEFVAAHFKSVLILSAEHDAASCYKISKSSVVEFDIPPDVFLQLFLKPGGGLFGKRYYTHCPDRFKNLSASDEPGFFYWGDDYFTQKMINPFVRNDNSKFTIDRLESYVGHLVNVRGKPIDGVAGDLRALGKEIFLSEDWISSASFSLEQLNDRISQIRESFPGV